MLMSLSRSPSPISTRIGLIIPSVNATIEPEFYRAAPPEFSFHSVRVMLRETTPTGLRTMNRDLAAAANLLASLSPAAVAYACTSGSFLDGPEALEKQTTELRAAVGCPVVATSAAMIDGLRSFGVQRLALATPYLDEVTELECRFLEACGFEVVSWRGLRLSGAAIREVPPERVYELAVEIDHPDAEALFVSCTDLRALEVVPALEETLGKPVMTSNQVTLWALLQTCGHGACLPGLGRLLQRAD